MDGKSVGIEVGGRGVPDHLPHCGGKVVALDWIGLVSRSCSANTLAAPEIDFPAS